MTRLENVAPAKAGTRVALHFHGQEITYDDLWSRIEQTASSLRVGKGDRVAWLGYNDPEMLVLLFACARLGAILVPLSWRLAPAEHQAILDDCGARQLLFDQNFALRARNLRVGGDGPRGSSDDLLIVYTSGTTGKPKGAVLTRSALLCNAENSVSAHDLTPQDHVLTVLPMFHVGGLNIQTVPALLSGATVSLQRRFDPGQWLADVASRRPSLSLLVPAAMQAVIQHPDWMKSDLSSLRLLNAGSMVVPDFLIRAFHARGVPVGQIYGCTETSPIAMALKREDAERKVGSVGKPSPHCEVKLESGEVWVRGPNVMRGYWNDPKATESALTHEGWFRTGDLARIDEDGFYWIMGRSKDVIISGGENIYPAELENVLADCPAIAESAVVGMEDAKWGESAVACVVLRPNFKISEEEIKALFKDRLARFKHPRRIIFLDSLPKNALGKVQKYELKQKLKETACAPMKT